MTDNQRKASYFVQIDLTKFKPFSHKYNYRTTVTIVAALI